MIMDNEWKGWKEDISTYFKAISWHAHRGVEETTESSSTETSFVPEIELNTKPKMSPHSRDLYVTSHIHPTFRT